MRSRLCAGTAGARGAMGTPQRRRAAQRAGGDRHEDRVLRLALYIVATPRTSRVLQLLPEDTAAVWLDIVGKGDGCKQDKLSDATVPCADAHPSAFGP